MDPREDLATKTVDEAKHIEKKGTLELDDVRGVKVITDERATIRDIEVKTRNGPPVWISLNSYTATGFDHDDRHRTHIREDKADLSHLWDHIKQVWADALRSDGVLSDASVRHCERKYRQDQE